MELGVKARDIRSEKIARMFRQHGIVGRQQMLAVDLLVWRVDRVVERPALPVDGVTPEREPAFLARRREVL